MHIYSRLLIIFYYLITYCSPEDLAYYLTKNSTRMWFKNFTRNTSPKNPYCSLCCIDTTKNTLTKICGKHTMCIFHDIYGPGCKGFLDIPLRGDEIDVILDAHNTIRNRVALGWEERGNPGPQPTASNMRVVEWNADLALIAHRWASQCVYGHDVCRDVLKYPVGQNIARGNFATTHDLAFIANWFDYVQYISEDDIKSFQLSLDSRLRSYTQLVWAETYQIGCSRVLFQKTTGAGNISFQEHFVCNYGPTGNIPAQPVYKLGEPCSNCPDGTGPTVNYQGLCGTEIAYDLVQLESSVLHKDIHPESKSLKRSVGGLQINFSVRLYPVNIYFVMLTSLSIIFA